MASDNHRDDGRRTRRDFLLTTAGASLLLLGGLGGCKSSDDDDDSGEPAPPPGPSGARYFTNPGDERAAALVVNGQLVTYFASKNAAGDIQHITHASVDAPDGDPDKRMSYDFAPNGDPTRASVATGETMLFAWQSPDRVIVTYRSADGAQETRFPYDFASPSSNPSAAPASGPPRPPMNAALKASLEGAARERMVSERTGTASSAQTSSFSNPGAVEVRCGEGAFVTEATVTGYVVIPTNVVDERNDVTFTESGLHGLFEYSLPIAPAPNPGEGYHRKQLEAALAILCRLNLSRVIAVGVAEALCLSLLAVPAIGAVGAGTCTAILAGAGVICLGRTVVNVAGAAVDMFSQEYLVTAIARHPKFGTKEARVTAKAGEPIPRAIVTFPGVAAIANLTTEPFDPGESEAYTIKAQTDCAGEGYTLELTIVGSDGYTDAKTSALSKDVHEVTLAVPGAKLGVQDKLTAKLTGPTGDTKASSITF